MICKNLLSLLCCCYSYVVIVVMLLLLFCCRCWRIQWVTTVGRLHHFKRTIESPDRRSYALSGRGCAAERWPAAEGRLRDSRVFVDERIVVDRMRARLLSVLSEGVGVGKRSVDPRSRCWSKERLHIV